MINVYIDPNSYIHLDNALFENNDVHNLNDCRRGWIYLKPYCAERGYNLQTIDKRTRENSREDDVYVSFDHKFLLRRIYWKLKNRNYPIFIKK